MKQFKFTVFIGFILFVGAFKMNAQPFPLSISIQVNPPYTANYTSYFSGASQVVMTIVNNSTNTYDIYLAGSITANNGEISVSSSGESPWSAPALLVPPGSHSYNGTSLQPFAQSPNVEYTGITQQDIISGILPEGNYQICMRAYGYNSLQPLSPAEPMGCSNIFTISYPPPPQIIAPLCGNSISRTAPQNIIFSWQAPTGIPPSVNPRYKFTLVLLNDGIDPLSALTNPVDPIFETELSTTSLNYGSGQPILLSPRTYAWRVQILDANVLAPQDPSANFQNNGFSEPCTFNYLEPGSSGNPFTLVFPMDGDTLPWDFMPIYHRYDPYSVNYISYNDDFVIQKNGVQADVYSRYNTWPNGPELSQEQALTISITQERAQHINLYKPMSGVSPAAISFTDGNTYSWDANIDIQNSAGPSLTGNLNGTFVSGMGRPQPIFPANSESVVKNKVLGLKFKTSNPPQRLVPPMAIMETTSEPGAHFFDGGLNERWILEVSRNQTFSSLVTSTTTKLGAGLDYLNGTCQEQCLLDALYKEETFNYTPTDTGWYFWRVRWLTNPNALTGVSYLDGPTWKFLVKDTISLPEDNIPPTPTECVNTCAGPPIILADKVPVSTAVLGNVVSIGMFSMTLTEITWSGTSATGKGTILVPFMRAPMKVKFSGININAKNQVYHGDVQGEYDNISIIPGGIAQGVSQIASLDQQQSVLLNNFVNTSARLVSQFASNNPMGLPIGLDQEVDDQRVTIGIVGLLFTPETATLNAMVSIGFAELNGWLSLGATNVCFHPDGIGGDGKGLLYLPADHDIPFGDDITLRFDKTEFTSNFSAVSDSGTYVSWDCRGFKALNVDGSVIFGRNILVEDKTDGTTGPAQIKGEFSCRIRRQGQWLARLNFNHPFQMAGAAGWGFDVEEAWLDFSDGQNPDGFHFPTGYEFDTTEFTGDQNINSIPHPELYWRGFYLKRLSVSMPPEFKTYSKPNDRLTASVNNMLIDRRGLSASFRVENIINVGEGNLGGWGFSIDTLNIDIVKNSFSRGGFVGDIRIPVSDSALHYKSMLKQNLQTRNFSYEFRITPKDTINAALWAAKLSLDRTSYISAAIDISGISARAELNGKITIDTQLPAVGRVNFKLMAFEKLVFQTQAPYIECGIFSFASPQKYLGGSDQSNETSSADESKGALSGYPVSITGIGLTMRDGLKAGLKFTLNLNLTGESNTFSASTSLAILGKLNLGGGQGQVWEYAGVELDSIGVSGSVGVVEIKGGLRFYNNDGTYGNGFKGIIKATFKPTIGVTVAAQFGEKQGNRYWFVDAQAVFSPGIPLMAGLDVYGFGGGAYYHMQRTTALPAAGMATADTSGKQAPGITLSGVKYVPDFNKSFGFSATVVFGNSGGGQAYNADVTFGAEFTNSGGIDKMYLRGNAFFMCELTERNNPQIHAVADISYDFANQIFDARFGVFVYIAGGLVTGVNSNNSAGEVHIYACAASFGRSETWFIHVGTPTTPIGLSFLKLFKTESYLMVGENLPPALPAPSEVASNLENYTNTRDLGPNGDDGFAFGSRTKFDTGKLGFLMFYAQLNMGMGYDMSLLNYGPSVYCEGASPGTTIGVNGWYAKGKIYAYIMGEIGIHVDAWFAEGDFKILQLNAAALLEGGLPNPSWLKGTCGGNYSILGGMVKGYCQFELKIGEKCTPVSETPLKIDILSDLVPQDNEKNVDCGINPEASFNMEVEKEFDLEEVGSNKPRRFRFVIERFELKKGEILVQTTQQISPDNFKAMLIPSAFLDPFTEFVVSIKIKAEEYNFNDNKWYQAKKRDGTDINAELTHTFKTGAYPDHIPERNVLVSYPFNTQRFYLQSECNQGFVNLFQQMPPLFNPQPTENTRRKFNVRFIPIDGGQELNAELSIQEDKMLNFEVPTLLNNKVYACQIISKDSIIVSSQIAFNSLNLGGSSSSSMLGGAASSGSSANSSMMVSSTLQQVYSNQGGGVETRDNRINGRTVRKNEKLLYVFFFKTSQYNSLQEKLSAFASTTTVRENWGNLEWLAPSFSGPEKFDVFDVNGYQTVYPKPDLTIKPLVGMVEARTGTWHTNWANPVIYDLAKNLYSRGYTNLELSRPYPIGVPPIFTVGFHSGNPTKNALQPSEYLPLSSSPNSVFGSSISMMSVAFSSSYPSPSSSMGMMFWGGAPAALKLNVETPYQTCLDWIRLITISNDALSEHGDPNYSGYYSEPVRTQFINFLNENYRQLYRGTYQTQFYYRTPDSKCGPENINSGIIKNYTY